METHCSRFEVTIVLVQNIGKIVTIKKASPFSPSILDIFKDSLVLKGQISISYTETRFFYKHCNILAQAQMLLSKSRIF